MSRDDGTELALSGVTNGSLDDKGELREQLSRASQEIHRLQEELRREREETRTKNVNAGLILVSSIRYLLQQANCNLLVIGVPSSTSSAHVAAVSG